MNKRLWLFHNQTWSRSGLVSHGSTVVLTRVQIEIRCIIIDNANMATRSSRLKTTGMTSRWPILCPPPSTQVTRKKKNKQAKKPNNNKQNTKKKTSRCLEEWINRDLPNWKIPVSPQNKMKSRYVLNTHYNLHFRGTGVNSEGHSSC